MNESKNGTAAALQHLIKESGLSRIELLKIIGEKKRVHRPRTGPLMHCKQFDVLTVVYTDGEMEKMTVARVGARSLRLSTREPESVKEQIAEANRKHRAGRTLQATNRFVAAAPATRE